MLDRLRYRIAGALLGKAESPTPKTFTGLQPPGIPVYTDMTVRKATREGYRISVWVYRGVRVIVQAISGIPWIVIDRKTGEEIPEHPFTKTWANPNPEFSSQDNMEFLVAHLLLVGNAFLQPVMIGGIPKEFWVAMPDLIRPIPSKAPGEWLKGYQVTDSEGRQEVLPRETFIHFMEFDPGNPYWGIGRLMAAARTVDTDNEAQDTQKISMQNRGMPSGILSPEEPMTAEQFEEAQRRMREVYLQKTKRREPWIVSRAMKWTETSQTMVEMDYIASRLQNMRAIGASLGVDPIFLGDKEASTYNNVLEARRALYELTAIPLLDDFRATINLKIAPCYKGDIYITYDLSDVAGLRQDFGQKIDQAKNLWAMGIPFQQINDKLALGFEEFPGWATGYLPLNLLPTGAAPSEEGKMLTKALNLEHEEQKAAHWKKVDRRRLAWWGIVQKKVTPLYQAEGKALEKAIKGKPIDDLKDITKKIIVGLAKDWEKTLTAITTALVEDFGNDIAEDLGGSPKSGDGASEIKWQFDPFRAAARSWIAKHCAESVTSILATNLDEVRAIIADGVTNNLTVPQIAKQLKQFYGDRSALKAMRVARTEVSASAGFGQREAAKQSGVVKEKGWLSSMDDRVRDSHLAIDGERKSLDERYSNGLMYPGDPSGDPAESIQCRCVEQYFTG